MRQPPRKFPLGRKLGTGPGNLFSSGASNSRRPTRNLRKGGARNRRIGMDTLVRLDLRSPSRVSRELGRALDRPSRAEAEQAVSTLIRWAGDDPGREGLLDTPARVVRAY